MLYPSKEYGNHLIYMQETSVSVTIATRDIDVTYRGSVSIRWRCTGQARMRSSGWGMWLRLRCVVHVEVCTSGWGV